MLEITELQNLSKKAAISAGKFLLEEKNSNKKIFSELGRDIKLDLDREAELKIRKILEHSDIPILGEEFGIQSEQELKWVVDPIDGTANYFRKLDQCCVSIALMKGDTSLVGTIYNFNNDEIYTAAQNLGAYLNGIKINVSNINSRDKASITTGFPASESVQSSLKFLEGLSDWKKVRMFGSAALSCAYVASGKCDYYAEKGVYLWDIAAGICLVKEAGGCTDFNLIDKERYEVVFSNSLL